MFRLVSRTERGELKLSRPLAAQGSYAEASAAFVVLTVQSPLASCFAVRRRFDCLHLHISFPWGLHCRRRRGHVVRARGGGTSRDRASWRYAVGNGAGIVLDRSATLCKLRCLR